MKLDTTIDFEALLGQAKSRHVDCQMQLKDLEKDPSPDARKKISRICDDYSRWVQRNIRDKGLTLETELFTGNPIAITAVVAGRTEI